MLGVIPTYRLPALHRPFPLDGVDHREVPKLALDQRHLVDVLVPVYVRVGIAVCLAGDRDRAPHHVDIAPEFALDLIRDVA